MFTVHVNKYSHANSGVSRLFDIYETVELARAAADRLRTLGYRFAFVQNALGQTVYEALS